MTQHGRGTSVAARSDVCVRKRAVAINYARTKQSRCGAGPYFEPRGLSRCVRLQKESCHLTDRLWIQIVDSMRAQARTRYGRNQIELDNGSAYAVHSLFLARKWVSVDVDGHL